MFRRCVEVVVSVGVGMWGPVPELTVMVARVAFPKGCFTMRLRDCVGLVLDDAEFGNLFPKRSGPRWSPELLTIVSILQYCDGLTDGQAAEAVSERIDWKYALGLDMEHTGFDSSDLQEFRDGLIMRDAAVRVFDTVLSVARQAGLLRARGHARMNATHVVETIRQVNRLQLVRETMRAALEQLTEVAPDWLGEHADPDWSDRYVRQAEETFRLPARDSQRAAWAAQVGTDGMRLWTLLTDPNAPAGLTELEQIESLRQVWIREYQVMEGLVAMCDPKTSPDDPQER